MQRHTRQLGSFTPLAGAVVLVLSLLIEREGQPGPLEPAPAAEPLEGDPDGARD